MKWKTTQKMKDDTKLAEEKKKCQVICPNCGWINHIYAFEKKRKLCKNCKQYIYKDDKTKFNYKMKEVMMKCKYSNSKKEEKPKM